LGHPHQAAASFQRALQVQANHAEALFNLGNLFQELGRTQEAIPLYRQLLGFQPNHPWAFNNLGNALLAERRVQEAISCYQQALSLDPSYPEAQLNLGTAFAELDCLPEAAQAYARAAQLRPDRSLWKLRHLSLCPTIFQNTEEIDQYLANLQAQLEQACALPLSVDPAHLAQDGFVPSFNLAHHGRDNRPLQEKFAALFRPHIPKRSPRSREGKPRLGFLVTAPHVRNFLRSMGGLVEHLNRQRFDVVVLCSESVLEAFRRQLPGPAPEWIPFPDRFLSAADRVEQAACDILYFHKVSADPLGYLLPFARLAHVQWTSWATHCTSGVAEVDYYVSSALVEPEEADAHYTESLVRLGSLPTYEYRPSLLSSASRSHFGLPEKGALYLCPQRLAKFHPAQDELFRGVLAADPHGHLVLLAGQNQNALQKLMDRFQRSLGPLERRIIVLPDQTPQGLRQLLSLGTVFLDICHYSASLMAYDAFSVDLPIVTLPGQFKVERYAQGFYRKMGLRGPLARFPEEYIQQAVRFGTDEDYRRDFRSQLASRKHLLFEDQSVVQEYEQFFERVLEGTGTETWKPVVPPAWVQAENGVSKSLVIGNQ
jgi:predicted O-linked N-acetylglucosamine transferase (SPINDLY family)